MALRYAFVEHYLIGFSIYRHSWSFAEVERIYDAFKKLLNKTLFESNSTLNKLI